MKRIWMVVLVMVAAIFPPGSGWAQAICDDGVKVGYGQASDGRAIELRLHVNNGTIERLEVLGGCDPVFIEGTGTVNDCSFIFNPADPALESNLTFMGIIDGDEFAVEDLPFIEVCGTTFGGAVNPGSSPSPPGSGGEDGGGTTGGNDGNDGGGGTGGNGERVVGKRVPITNIRPIAQLIGVEVEVNPPTIDLRRVASGVADVSFTARLVWSNDNLPKDFKHDPSKWNFLAPNEDGNWDGWESGDSWGASMRERLKMEVDPDKLPNPDKLKKGDPLTWNFKLSKSSLDREKIRSKQVPVRAVYRPDPDDPNTEIEAVVNLRIENQTEANPLATSSGPAARNVTYRRVLE